MPEELKCRMIESFDGLRLKVCSNAWRSLKPPYIFMIHGSPGQLSNWRYQIDYLLSKGYSIVAYDLRGYGGSGKPLKAVLEDYVKDLKCVADSVNADLSESVIAGHSFGTMIALAYCSVSECGSLALVGPVYKLRTDFTDWVIQHLPPLIWRKLFFTYNPLTKSMYRKMFFSEGVEEPVFKEFIDENKEYIQSLPNQSFKYLYNMLDYDASRYCRKLRISGEVAVVVGDEDRVTPPEDAVRIHKLIPGSKLFIIRGAGHMVLYEKPSEVNKVLEELLKGLSR